MIAKRCRGLSKGSAERRDGVPGGSVPPLFALFTGVRGRDLADTLLHACPKLRILATSREALGIGGENTWPVPSLGLPDAEVRPPPKNRHATRRFGSSSSG
jgi:hypothetical protein